MTTYPFCLPLFYFGVSLSVIALNPSFSTRLCWHNFGNKSKKRKFENDSLNLAVYLWDDASFKACVESNERNCFRFGQSSKKLMVCYQILGFSRTKIAPFDILGHLTGFLILRASLTLLDLGCLILVNHLFRKNFMY